MVINHLAIVAAILLMAAGEAFKNETKEVYEKEGYNWSNVIILSTISALIGGYTSLIVINYSQLGSEWNPATIVFASAIGSYILMQSFMTDLRVLLINRKILRVAYLSTFVVGVYNIATSEIFRPNLFPFIVFIALILVLFVFSSIGASDIRAIGVLLPFVVSIGGYLGIQLFIAALLAVALGMSIRNYYRDREKMRELKKQGIASGNYQKMNKLAFYKVSKDIVKADLTEKEMAMPVGPYMIIPFLAYLIFFPLFL